MKKVNEVILYGVIESDSRNPIENIIVSESIVDLDSLGFPSQNKIGLDYIDMISRKENILLELRYKDYKISVNKDLKTGEESVSIKIENTKKIHIIDVSFLAKITWLKDKESFDKVIKDLV